MAILLEFINVIIPISTIERCHEIGGFAGLLKQESKAVGRRVWYDNYLYRDGAMNPYDTENIVDFWKQQGLVGDAIVDGHQEWMDLCVVDYFIGPTLPCRWLNHDPQTYSVSLSGTLPGEIVGPSRR